MKIKSILNNKISSFEFKFDLSKGEYLKKILELYCMPEIYVCVYGLNKQDIKDKLNKIGFRIFRMSTCSQSLQDFALNIKICELTNLFSIIGNDFDEIIIWNCFTDWESFIKEQLNKDSFLTLHKKDIEETPLSFYLDFCPCKCNRVEIICDRELSNDVTKNDLLTLLTN